MEIYNFLLAHGEREIIENVETLEEAREIVKFKLIYEGDHAQYNFDQKKLSIKNFGGDSEVRKIIINPTENSITFFATHGSIL